MKVGLVRPNMIRPFPAEEVRQAFKNVKALLVGELADSYGARGGNMTHEIRSALQLDQENETIVMSRIFGVGGKDFYPDEAEEFVQLAMDAAKKGFAEKPFDYFGHVPGEARGRQQPIIEPMTGEAYKTGLIHVTQDVVTGKLKVKIPPLRALNRLA